ncbi:MAG: LysR family transcriptional regulator substrate-binding protein [Granulosicoccus sp.]
MSKKIKPRLEKALSLTDRARTEADEFVQINEPKLSIGMSNTVGSSRMMSIVSHLEQKSPQLKLILKTTSSKEVVEWLLSGEIDVGIVSSPEYPELIAINELYDERYMVAAPPDHRFSRMNAIPLQELEKEKTLKRLNCEYMDYFHSSLTLCGTNELQNFEDSLDAMDVRHEIADEGLIRTMITAGMGCAIVPEYMTNYESLILRPLIEPEISRTIGIATVRGRPHTPVVSYFSNLCHNMKGELGF